MFKTVLSSKVCTESGVSKLVPQNWRNLEKVWFTKIYVGKKGVFSKMQRGATLIPNWNL